MNTKTASALEAAIRAYIIETKTELALYEEIHRFNLDIKCEGRPDGDVSVEFIIGLNYEPDVKSGRLGPLLAEAVSRTAWNKAHAPLCIGNIAAE
jgi:hypothetical protein